MIFGRYIGINIKFSTFASPNTAFTNKELVLLYQAIRVIFLNQISCTNLPHTSFSLPHP